MFKYQNFRKFQQNNRTVQFFIKKPFRVFSVFHGLIKKAFFIVDSLPNHKLKVASCELKATSHKLQATSYKPMPLILATNVWITMKFGSIFGYFGMNKNYLSPWFYFRLPVDQLKLTFTMKIMKNIRKTIFYQTIPFKSFSNFMVKKQRLFVLS